MHLVSASTYTQLLLAFLVLTIFDRLSAATNVSQLKMPQQQAIIQNHHQISMQQPQQQQQEQTNTLTHPSQQLKSSVQPAAILHDSNIDHNNHNNNEQQNIDLSSTLISDQMPTVQYTTHTHADNDKNVVMQDLYKSSYNSEEEVTDSYQMLNELKREKNQQTVSDADNVKHHHGSYPWNLYQNDYAQQSLNNLPPPTVPNTAIFSNIFPSYETPRYMPIWAAAPASVFVPYPFYMPTQMMATPVMPTGGGSISSNYEDSMSRMVANTVRRTAPDSPINNNYLNNNSPIYYVRLPTPPYLFLPSFNVLPYHSSAFAQFSPFSSVFNIPINFMSNGKPNNIYQVGESPNDIQTHHFQFNHMPPHNPYDPPNQSQSNNNHPYPHSSSLTLSTYSSNPSQANALNSAYIGSMTVQPDSDSRLMNLKRRYYFNGRPEDIYVLQNNLKTLYSSEKNYY